MEDCKYSQYCMCQTCEYQINNTGKECCTTCADCRRENEQIHDIWSCTKYERKKFLR